MSASAYCEHSVAWRKLHRKAKEEERRADDAEAPRALQFGQNRLISVSTGTGFRAFQAVNVSFRVAGNATGNATQPGQAEKRAYGRRCGLAGHRLADGGPGVLTVAEVAAAVGEKGE